MPKLTANRLWKTTAKRTKTSHGLPQNSEGRNGEITIRDLERGVVLFAKFNN